MPYLKVWEGNLIDASEVKFDDGGKKWKYTLLLNNNGDMKELYYKDDSAKDRVITVKAFDPTQIVKIATVVRTYLGKTQYRVVEEADTIFPNVNPLPPGM